jgi:hypothetical protein
VGKKGYAIGLDINKSTVEFAQKCLKRLDLPNDLIANVAFFNLNVYFLDKKIKFDRLIIAAVCPRNIVMHILGQMKDGGICVLVVCINSIKVAHVCNGRDFNSLVAQTEDMKLVRYRLTPKGDWTQEILGEVKEALPKLVIPDMLQMEGQLQHANDTIDALKAWITKWTGVDPTKKGLGGSGGSGSSGLSNPGSVPTSPLAGSGPTPNKTSGGSVVRPFMLIRKCLDVSILICKNVNNSDRRLGHPVALEQLPYTVTSVVSELAPAAFGGDAMTAEILTCVRNASQVALRTHHHIIFLFTVISAPSQPEPVCSVLFFKHLTCCSNAQPISVIRIYRGGC